VVYRYILFYKPYGVLCQFTDTRSEVKRETLKDYIDIPGVYPVGRLDRDSEGLLLLTNDNRIKHRLSHRQFAHPRTYWVQVEHIPTDKDLDPLRRGIKIKDYHTRPAQVRVLESEPSLPPRDPPIRDRAHIPTTWLEITLTEGRNRQVRRMTAAIGFPTLRLVRVKIEIEIPKQPTFGLSWDGLQPGEWREVNPTEKKALQQLRKH
jgi:23S rRNA pseudouridine2457 synthase